MAVRLAIRHGTYFMRTLARLMMQGSRHPLASATELYFLESPAEAAHNLSVLGVEVSSFSEITREIVELASKIRMLWHVRETTATCTQNELPWPLANGKNPGKAVHHQLLPYRLMRLGPTERVQ